MDKKLINLLLSYNYPLSVEYDKFLLLGYHPITFQPCVVLQNIKKHCAVVFTVFEWQGIVLLIDRLVLNGNIRKVINFLPTLSVLMEKTKDGEVTIAFRRKIKKNKTTVVLRMDEWYTFLSILQLSNPVLHHLQLLAPQVEIYTLEYFKRCADKKCVCLLEQDFFILAPLSDCNFILINFSRLFYEIPIFCLEKIMENVFK